MRFLPDAHKIAKTDASAASALAHGFELAGVVIVFFFVGWGLDVVFGTRPVFVVVLTLLGVFGLLARAWYDFSTKMDEFQAARRSPQEAKTALGPTPVDEHA